jgi:hypothetical protein
MRGRPIFFMNFRAFLTELCAQAAALSSLLMAVDGAEPDTGWRAFGDGTAGRVMVDKKIYYRYMY